MYVFILYSYGYLLYVLCVYIFMHAMSAHYCLFSDTYTMFTVVGIYESINSMLILLYVSIYLLIYSLMINGMIHSYSELVNCTILCTYTIYNNTMNYKFNINIIILHPIAYFCDSLALDFSA